MIQMAKQNNNEKWLIIIQREKLWWNKKARQNKYANIFTK
jgi:hypothetical protein